MRIHPVSATATPAREFYRHALRALSKARIPFLIGGAYALEWYTNIAHRTKDLDIMVCPDDCRRVLDLMDHKGYRTELPFPHWLGKVYRDGARLEFIDVIFNMGNGLAPVDATWFEHVEHGKILGMSAHICSAADLIFSKAFVMERERFDGADVAHLIRSCGDKLDWAHLIDRFGAHWRVLLAHLVLFAYVYPTVRDRIPDWAMKVLKRRLTDKTRAIRPSERVCRGTMLSREQYLIDIEQWGFEDARLQPRGTMSQQQIATWTEAVTRRPDAKQRPPQH